MYVTIPEEIRKGCIHAGNELHQIWLRNLKKELDAI